MTKFGYVKGNKESNWMDMRDMLINHLQNCDTELTHVKLCANSKTP